MRNLRKGRSLACLVNLSNAAYEVFAVDFPPHMLEWDTAGSVHMPENHKLFLEGSEIKSPERCKDAFNPYPVEL